jgi:predicted aspartyl protease
MYRPCPHIAVAGLGAPRGAVVETVSTTGGRRMFVFKGRRDGKSGLAYIPVRISASEESTIVARIDALIDTGASHSAINRELAEAIQATTTLASLDVVGVTGTQVGTSCNVELLIGPDSGNIPMSIEVAIVDGMKNAMILGMNALGYFDLVFKRNGSYLITR